MPEIQLLDQATINQIAAGEVIDRPSSVVKELLENAIDAKATAITVEIKDGGISFIRITDNGCGIEKDQVRKAFLRHATSKLHTIDDLLDIGSLGFRGEALSSIAAIAQVELISKPPEAMLGISYQIEDGEEKSLTQIGAPDGTTILVRNLFYHVPARKKFLKTAATEGNYINQLMENMAMLRPDISMRFINGGQNKLYTSGNGRLKDLIYTIYGREISSNVLEINYECPLFAVTGYIGKPIISRGNRTFENYYINGRFVKSRLIAAAIEQAYKPFMMQHRYPFVAFQIEINPEKIDVNVHPSKMELRFSNQQGIYNLLYEAISKGLHEPELIPEVEMSEIKVPGMSEKRQEKKTVIRDAGNPYRADGTSPKMRKSSVQEGAERAESWSQSEMPSAELQTQISTEKTVSTGDEKLDYFMQKMRERVYASHLAEAKEEQEKNIGAKETKMAALDENPAVDIQNKGAENRAYSDKSKEKTERDPEKTESNLFLKDLKAKKVKQLDLFEEQILKKEARQEYRIIGQVFETYWLIQYRDSLYIIDQHAAHERVLYERALAGMKKREYTSQYLSPPIILSLSMQEIDVLETFKDRFTAIGFEIEPFGGDEYAVRAIPDNLFGIAKKELLLEMLDSLSDGLSTSLEPELIDEKIASMSCKAAVKGNMKLSYAEMDELINELLSLDNPYHCPHGRPTIIAMTKRELEKKFKRIV